MARAQTRWTPARDAKVAEMLRDGKTAKEIGEELGLSRNAIIGRVTRSDELKAIGFSRSPGQHKDTKQGKPSNRHRRRLVRVPAARKSGPLSIVALRTVEAPLTRQPGSVSEMVDRWIAERGGPRRFESGASADYFAVQNFLGAHGVSLSAERGRYRLAHGRGRPRVVGWKDVLAVVDEIRAGNGLQPIMAA